MTWLGGAEERGKNKPHSEQTPVECAPHLLGEWIEDGVAKATAIHLLAPTAPQRPSGKTRLLRTH